MKYKNLVFLGTSHIAKQSLDEVEEYINKEKPDIIALELDKKRAHALIKKPKNKLEFRNIKHIGVKGFIFSMLGAWAERKLGKLVGITPGSEMKKAMRIAKKKKIGVALIDQDIEITLRRISQAITWKEKINFLLDIIKAMIKVKGEIEFDLKKVPEKKIIKLLIEKLKHRYPNIYKVLIEERNIVISDNLRNLMASHPDKKILVILGAGHVEEVLGLINLNSIE